VRAFSIFRQQIAFSGSPSFWEENYARGDTSGPGSYGSLATTKAAFVNTFVQKHAVRSVIEFGCGDGHQLSLARYPRYVGLDVSPTAIQLCNQRFAGDNSKSFFIYNGECFYDRSRFFVCDTAISLDVIYHLVEDEVFERYMKHLFNSAERFVVVYSSDAVVKGTAPHVRHREFRGWVQMNCPNWGLIQMTPGPVAGPDGADFFVYERASQDSPTSLHHR